MSELSPDELLTTTRAVRRRLDLDRPVEADLVDACLRIALQAPSGSSSQRWAWIVVTDPDQRARIAAEYRQAFAEYRETAVGSGQLFGESADPGAHTVGTGFRPARRAPLESVVHRDRW